MTPPAMATFTDIIAGLGNVSTWFWARFSDLIAIITGNSLLLWAVVLAIVAGSVGVILKVVRRFGVKGRRS